MTAKQIQTLDVFNTDLDTLSKALEDGQQLMKQLKKKQLELEQKMSSIWCQYMYLSSQEYTARCNRENMLRMIASPVTNQKSSSSLVQ